MSRFGLLSRLLVCLALLLTHYFLLFLPLSELFLMSVLLINPRWFRDFLNRTAPDRNESPQTKEAD